MYLTILALHALPHFVAHHPLCLAFFHGHHHPHLVRVVCGLDR